MSNKLNFDDFIIFDGAMGTMLQSLGMKAGELPESFNMTHPNIITNIHKQYADAGANILTTNTFGANHYKLQDTPWDVETIITQAIKLAKSASSNTLVALDIGPLGQLMEPFGNLSFNDAYLAFKEQIIAGNKAGADLILIETMSDVYEAKAAILAARENSNLPIICTMTFQENGRTLTGTDPLSMVNILQNLSIDALGINCSLGPSEMLPLVKEILKYSQIPVIVQPNAGLPKLVNNETVFDFSPSDFANFGVDMAKLGVSILGGCCGTTTKHISKLKSELSNIKLNRPQVEKLTAVSSSTKTEVLGKGVKVIGERINPTGKKLLQAALIDGNMDYLLKEAINQKEAGAHILDINVGLPQINEEETMTLAVSQIQSLVNLPLQIDSVVPSVIEAGARVCSGRPIINSVNGESKIMESIFPIAKKYGTLVIGLTLDEKGIPKTAKERLDIASRIVKTASTYGIPKEDIIIDCLVLTASAQQKEVRETIEAVRLVKKELKVATTLGISNVSFGLPSRNILNRTFLATALGAGLDAPILNPLETDMIDTVNSFNLLWNYDKDSKDYIQKYSNTKAKPIALNDSSKEKDLQKIVINGLKEDSANLVKKLLKTTTALDIVDNQLIPALDIVGEKYELGEIFLPQLIQSAETVKAAFEVIKLDLINNNNAPVNKGKVILATVKGDIHDIGKNIVKVLLENYGYQVFDLGRDVPIERIINCIRENNVKLVGLSALMTTTVKNMELTIKEIKKHFPTCQVMVGGAVLNENYASMIGADFYAKDAKESVNIANNVLQNH